MKFTLVEIPEDYNDRMMSIRSKVQESKSLAAKSIELSGEAETEFQDLWDVINHLQDDGPEPEPSKADQRDHYESERGDSDREENGVTSDQGGSL